MVEVMTEKETAGELGLSVATLRAWRHRKTGPGVVYGLVGLSGTSVVI